MEPEPMDSEQKYFLALAAIIAITILGIAVCTTVYHIRTTQAALENGYEDVNNSWIKRSSQ